MPESQLPRVLEVELMDTPEEAAGYDAMDHAQVNARFVADFLAEHGSGRGGWYVDVGSGTALIPILLATSDRNAKIVAIDGAENMLALGAQHVKNAGLADRVKLERHDAKKIEIEDGRFEAVISNSIIHHIPSPEIVFREMIRLVAPGGTLFIRDLARPVDENRLNSIVERYAHDAPLIARAMFLDSLNAALTPSEVAEMVRPLGLPGSCVAMTSDRHWTLVWKRPVTAN